MKRFKHTLFGGGSFLVISMIAINIINFVFSIFLGRHLSLDDFGQIAIINTLIYVLSIGLGALSNTVNYRVAYLDAKIGKNAGTYFFLGIKKSVLKTSIISCLIFIFFIPALTGFFRLKDTMILFSFIPMTLASTMVYLNMGYLKGRFHFYGVAVILLADAVTKLIAAFTLIHFDLSQYIFLVFVLSSLVSALTAFLFGYKRSNPVSGSGTYRFPRRFFASAVITGFAMHAFLTIDMAMVKHYLTASEAGQYGLLAITGKIIFYLGSMLNTFSISLISREEGLGKNTNKTFYVLLAMVGVLVFAAIFTLSQFSHIFIPLLLGNHALPVVKYIPQYTLTMGLFTVADIILTYHLIKRHYVFSFFSFLILIGMIAGIINNHASINSIIQILWFTSIINVTILGLLHLLHRKKGFFTKNLIDLVSLLFYKQPAQLKTGKRILIFNWRDTRHRYAGGAEIYIHELAERWVKMNNEVTVFCGNDSHSPRYETLNGIKIIRRGGFYFVYIWAFIYYVFRFRNRYDVIIDCQNGIPFFTPLYVNEPVFCLMFHVHQEVFRYSLIKPLATLASLLENRLMPFVYENIRFLTISPSSKTEIEKLGLGKAGIDIIFPGINTELFKPAEKSKTPLVLYVGRLKYYKSINLIIASALSLINKIPRVRFIIAGDGEERRKLEKLTRQLHLENRIKFLGQISLKEKIRLFQKAWVFVNPSYMEGWGLTTIEANACGTPVVASNVSGLKDAIRNPHTGFLTEYGNINEFSERIYQLITDKEMREYMGKNAIEWAKKYSWNESAVKSLRIIQ